MLAPRWSFQCNNLTSSLYEGKKLTASTFIADELNTPRPCTQKNWFMHCRVQIGAVSMCGNINRGLRNLIVALWWNGRIKQLCLDPCLSVLGFPSRNDSFYSVFLPAQAILEAGIIFIFLVNWCPLIACKLKTTIRLQINIIVSRDLNSSQHFCSPVVKWGKYSLQLSWR